jgi:hypothetical protein
MEMLPTTVNSGVSVDTQELPDTALLFLLVKSHRTLLY